MGIEFKISTKGVQYGNDAHSHLFDLNCPLLNSPRGCLKQNVKADAVVESEKKAQLEWNTQYQGEIIPTQKDPVARSFRDYGNVYLLSALAEEIGLIDCLKQVYGDLWKQIITCVFYEISEAKPLYLCRLWTELSFSEGLHDGLDSQRISELLKEIGEQSQRRLDFFKAWIQRQEQTKSLYYDMLPFILCKSD